MRAWLVSLGGTPPRGRIYRPEDRGVPDPSPGADLRLVRNDDGPGPADQRPETSGDGPQEWPDAAPKPADDDAKASGDDGDEDPRIDTDKRSDIVPRRPGASAPSDDDDGFWASHQFWKGIVIGAVIAVLVKTVMAVRAPYGIDWFGF